MTQDGTDSSLAGVKDCRKTILVDHFKCFKQSLPFLPRHSSCNLPGRSNPVCYWQGLLEASFGIIKNDRRHFCSKSSKDLGKCPWTSETGKILQILTYASATVFAPAR